MKKLSVVTIIAMICVFSIHHTYTADQGLHIEGLGEAIAPALKNEVVPALENALKNVIDEKMPALKTVLEDVIDKKTPVFKEAAKDALVEAVPHILLSTAGLIVTSAGIMLMYQGLKADSTNDEDDNSAKKVNTTKLLGYGSTLIIIGVATIMHTSIRNYFSNPKP